MYFSRNFRIGLALLALYFTVGIPTISSRYSSRQTSHQEIYTRKSEPTQLPAHSPTSDNTLVMRYSVKDVRHEEHGVEFLVDRVVQGVSPESWYNLVAYYVNPELRNLRSGCVVEERIERSSKNLIGIRIVSCM